MAFTDPGSTEICADIWTVHAGTPVTDLEMALRAALSHELVEQIRYRTREGMKIAVTKGKAATRLSYGYVLSQQRDANGDRIRGLRDIDPVKAEIIRRIFRLYADGMSRQDIASLLNSEGLEGPDGIAWRDTAVRGWKSRGTGILNNESYIGRIVWNKQQCRKNPGTERRTARLNDRSEWIVKEVPSIRIVGDELWKAARARDEEVAAQYHSGATNRLNATQRPELRAAYEDYLRRQRGLSERTIIDSWRFAGQFLDFRFPEETDDLANISAADIAQFLHARVVLKAPRDKTVPSHLRNFFRYLFKAGKTATNLANAVPRVAQRFGTRLPRHISLEQVEMILAAVRDTAPSTLRN